MRHALIFLILSGCATTLAKDASEPASEKNYPSAEFSFNGRDFLGLGTSVVERGSSFSAVSLKIQGYLDGTASAFSKACGVNEKKTYTQNAKVEIPLTGEVKTSCVFSILVQPRLEGADLKPLRGEFFLKAVAPGKTWQGHSFKLADYADEVIETLFPSEKPVDAVIAGCSASAGRFTFTPEEGAVYTSTRDFMEDSSIKRCIAEGSFANEDHRTFTSWQIWRYVGDFSPLPDPEINFDGSFFGDYLRVTADENVLAIIWQGGTILGREAKIPLTEEKESFLRFITTSGRTLLCQYNLETRRYFCLR